jgi:hypothetical protein
MESKGAALLVLLAITIQAAAAAAPFTQNYLAETDAFHTRVLNAGERVDLVLDKQSGEKSSNAPVLKLLDIHICPIYGIIRPVAYLG